jgi:hypothetical protein
MSPEPHPQAAHVRLGQALRRRRRRTIAVLGIFAVATLLLAGWVVWRTTANFGGVQVRPPPNEYVVFFVDDLNAAEQVAQLRRHPQAEFVEAGKLPGVVVIRIHGDVDAALRAFRQDATVFRVQKSVSGMICH